MRQVKTTRLQLGPSKEAKVPKVSRESATTSDQGPVRVQADELEGYNAQFVTFRQDIDGTPLMKGLPDDKCQCPHWGYVFKGAMTMRFGEHEEIFEAGDAFYAPPGHVPVKHEPGTEILQFSPAAELAETEAAIRRNMEAMQGA